MSINLKMPDIRELKPKITVCGVGGAGGNAVNNMIQSGLEGVDFIVANTDAQALSSSKCDRIIQMGLKVTEGLGAGSHPEVGSAAAQEVLDEIRDHLMGSHMCFITAGMGGGTGTGAAPVIAKAAREMGILTVGVVTKPFQFEGVRRMRTAENGILELQSCVDTLIVIPNQNLFRVANERTTFADAFALADQVLFSGVACITDLMVKEGLINLDFADVRSVMRDMGKAMMGTGEASGDNRAITAAEAAIANPLLDETSMRGARGLLISITGGQDLTLYEVDEAATRIREEVDPDANIIMGATFDAALDGVIRVSVVATGIDSVASQQAGSAPQAVSAPIAARPVHAAPAPAVASAQAATATAAPSATPMPSLAELTEKLKASSERIQAMNAQNVQAVARAQPVESPHEPVEITQTIPLIQQPDEAVNLQKVAPRPALFTEAVEVAERHEPAPQMPAAEFIPPAAEKPLRATRMPTIDELPMPAQAQVRAQQAPMQQPSAEKRRTSLIERLAGMARREADAPMPTQAPPAAASRPVAPPPRPAAPAPAAAADYARRPAQPAALSARNAQGGLDMHGRPAQARAEEDHLDIPAFLRRQSS